METLEFQACSDVDGLTNLFAKRGLHPFHFIVDQQIDMEILPALGHQSIRKDTASKPHDIIFVMMLSDLEYSLYPIVPSRGVQ